MNNTLTNNALTNNSAQAFDPWILWLSFRKHWGWVIPLGLLLGSLAVVGIYSTFEKEYEATAMLEANRDFVVFPTNNGFGRDLAKSERQLIMQGGVLESVLASPKLASVPSLSNPNTREQEIAKRITISNAGTENYLMISYRDSNAKEAVKVCNEIVDQYLAIRDSAAQRRNQQLMDLLDPSIRHWKDDVASKRSRISELSRKSLGYDPFKIKTSDERNTREAELHAALGTLEIDIEIAKAKKKQLEQEALSPKTPDSIEIQRYIDNNEQVVQKRRSMDSLRDAISSLERKDQHDNVKRAIYQRYQEDYINLERELTQLKVDFRPKAIEELQKLAEEKAKDDQKQQTRELNKQLADFESRYNALKAEYDEEIQRVQSLNGATFELYIAEKEYERAAVVLDKLDDRLIMFKTEQRQKNSSMQIVSPAKESNRAIEEMPVKKMGMVGFAGFMVPYAIAVLLEFLVKRIVDSKRLEATIKAPLLGEISRYTGGTLNDSSRRMFTESVDALRANLSFKLEGVRSIVITSSMPAEGKSSVASQLAISLAKAFEEPVLLIDADVRLPGLHSMFGLSFGPGLTNVLRGQVDVVEAINTSPGHLVHVMTAGKLSGSPHALLGKKNVKEFLASVPERYRYIVIDTAPVLPAAETLSIAAAADATIVCAMRDVSRTDHLQRAQRQLTAAGANILGTVFSGIPSREYAYRYGDYRYAYGAKS
jgi:polysaccharide biosynthesis transport protein